MKILKKVSIAAIRGYQRFLSPFLPPSCRFYPSCSEYAAQSIEKHGFRKGAVQAAKRLARCHPWQPGGFDPVD